MNAESSLIVSIGAVCFGAVVGYLTYRTLARSGPVASVSDLASVLAVIGGGTVTGLFGTGTTFGWYSIGLFAGMVAYAALTAALKGRAGLAEVMGDDDLRPPSLD